MPVSVPPMTSRQAKKAAKKKTAQFQYSASQMRRADRIDELEERRRNAEDKERRRKANKIKRDEQTAKERSAKDKLLQEGKIAVEDTWGEVTASQPRLNAFFVKRVTRQQSKILEASQAAKENAPTVEKAVEKPLVTADQDEPSAFDSQEETLVDKSNAPGGLPTSLLDDISDADLLRLLSPLPEKPDPGHLPLSSPLRFGSPQKSTETKTTVPLSTQARHILAPSYPSKMSSMKRNRSESPEPEDRPIRRYASRLDFAIAEDWSAGEVEAQSPRAQSFHPGTDSASDGPDRTPMRALSADEIYERSQPDPEIDDPNVGPYMFNRQEFQVNYTAAQPAQQASRIDMTGYGDDMNVAINATSRLPAATRNIVSSEAATQAMGPAYANAFYGVSNNSNIPALHQLPVQQLVQQQVQNNTIALPRTPERHMSRKRTKRFHYSDSTPGRLPSDADTDDIFDQDFDTGHPADRFSDDGIDDDTLAAFTTTGSGHSVGGRNDSFRQASPSPRGGRTCRRPTPKKAIPDYPSPSDDPGDSWSKVWSKRVTNPIGNSFNSIDDEDLLGAEQELVGNTAAKTSTTTTHKQAVAKGKGKGKERAMDDVFPNIAPPTKSRSAMMHNNKTNVSGQQKLDDPFVKPAIPYTKPKEEPTAPFSTQDALDAAFEDVEAQNKAGSAKDGNDDDEDEDVEMGMEMED